MKDKNFKGGGFTMKNQNYRPNHTKEMEHLLNNDIFVKENGEIILSILTSKHLREMLKQRIDFLVYATILKNHNTSILPHEIDPISADAFFELVEDDIKRLNLANETIIIDELFRQYTSYMNGEKQKELQPYEYFTAPYFSSLVNSCSNRQGVAYLENFTRECFSKPLEMIITALQKQG